MNLLDTFSVFVFTCPEVRVLVLQEFHLMVVYSPSNYLLCFRCHLMTYRYRLIYFPDLHRPSQIKNPMLRQHYKIVWLVGVFPFTLFYVSVFLDCTKMRFLGILTLSSTGCPCTGNNTISRNILKQKR